MTKLFKILSLVVLSTLSIAVLAGCPKDDGTKVESGLFRDWTPSGPSTLNPLIYKDNAESDVLSLILGSLYNLDFNKDFTGYEMKAFLADQFAQPVQKNESGDWENITDFSVDTDAFNAWKVTIRQGLKYSDGQAMDIDDFIFTWKMALDPLQGNSRANYFYSTAGFPIKGGKDYFTQLNVYDEDGKVTEVKPAQPLQYEKKFEETVGIHKIDEYTMILELDNELKYNRWDVQYNLSSFLYAPINEALYTSCLSKDWKQNTYGTSPSKILTCGPYNLTYYETNKELRFEKNANYVPHPSVSWQSDEHVYTPKKIKTVIVKDADVALEMFQRGELDVSNIPASKIDQYKNNPDLLVVPGATTFRFNVNQMTQAESDKFFGAGTWSNKAILQEQNFLWALYFGIDRQSLCKNVLKTNTPAQTYFSSAYVLGDSGVAYRDTEWGKLVGSGIFENDLDLSEATCGYAPDFAVDQYIKALDSMVAKGVFNKDASYKVSIELASFDGVTHENMLAWMKDSLGKLFNNATIKAAYPNVTFELTTVACPDMDVYYEKQMKGKYDLAIGGISGGAMDPIGFLEVFCEDDRGGLMLNYGIDTTDANILIDLENGEGEQYFSYDALYSIANGPAFIMNGTETGKNASGDVVSLGSFNPANKNAGGSEGKIYDFKYCTADIKCKILATMERYLINIGTSIPVFTNSGYSIYSSRVKLPTKGHVPLMGFGALFGQIA